jgi:tetratricopeptide (TPR) repeat protein
LGEASLHAGQSGRAAVVLRQALSLKMQSTQPVDEEILYANLIEALMLGTRYAELLALVEQVNGSVRSETAGFAEYFRGIALAQMGSDLNDAVRHLQRAELLLSQPQVATTTAKGAVTLGDIKFELGNIAARRGDLTTAIAYFRESFAVSQPMSTDRELRIHILACNNLAYHLHLQGEPTAATYAQRGLTLAQEKGALSALPYLYSTLGEIALARQALDEAEHAFQEGLSLAKQFAAAERIAGLTANLGLAAKARGERARACTLLMAALAQTEALKIRFPSVQIRLWLASLLPPAEARTHLAQARLIAAEDGYGQLLAEIASLEHELF